MLCLRTVNAFPPALVPWAPPQARPTRATTALQRGMGTGSGTGEHGGFPTALTAPRAAGAERGVPGPPGRATRDMGTGPRQGRGAWRWRWARSRCGAGGLLSAASRWHARSGNCAAEQRLCTEPSLQLLSCSTSCSPVLQPHRTAPLHSPIPQPHPGTVRCWWPNTTIIRRDKPQTGSMAMSAWCTRSWVALPVAAPVPGRQLTAAFPPAPAPEPQRRRAPACCVHQHRLSGRAGR